MGRRRRRKKGNDLVTPITFILITIFILEPSSMGFIIFFVLLFFICFVIIKILTKPSSFAASPASRSNKGKFYSPSIKVNEDIEDDLYPVYKESSQDNVNTPSIDESRWSLELIKALEWKRFEELCSAYFEEEGYRADVTRLGADGGIDILLYKESESSNSSVGVVQCKAWNTYKVGVKPIRELYGVMHAEKATLGIFITSGEFTKEAIKFSKDKNLVLYTGELLLKEILNLSEESQQKLLKKITEGDYLTPSCPSCGVKMVIRTSKKGNNIGHQFWGCPTYPRCRSTLQIKSI